MAKANQTLATDRLNELVDHFMQLHKLIKITEQKWKKKTI